MLGADPLGPRVSHHHSGDSRPAKPELGARPITASHKILVAVFHILAGDTEFRELGPAHLDHQHKHRVTKGLVRRLDALGYEVILRPKLAA
jgi:hypothetical protein